jgi:hypothetical protein
VLSRRDLLRTGVLGAGSLGIAPAFFRAARAGAAPARPGAGPYGPLGEPDANGIRLPKGFRSRLIARASTPVGGTGYVLPPFPDGSATFPAADGGWILVTNSEAPRQPGGGASAIRFGPDGTVIAAYRILGDTTMNCSGGATPWGTWLSCEEHGEGRVWECDPTGERGAYAHAALGRFTHESVCVDPAQQRLYLTEDVADGGFYRFTPETYPDLSEGVLEVASVARGGRVSWHPVPEPGGGEANPTRRQVAGMTPFRRGEGLCFDAGIVYIATTGDSVVHAYDTRSGLLGRIYDAAAVQDPPLVHPDNLTAGRAGDVFACEDVDEGDPLDMCVLTPEGEVARFLQLTGAQHGRGASQSELTGPSFDPSGTRLYVSSQRAYGVGAIYEVRGPFRPARPGGTAPPVPRSPALGVELPARIRRTRLLRDGLPIALTLDRAAGLRVDVTARMRSGGRLRTVRIAALRDTLPAGAHRARVRTRRAARPALRRRRKPLRATVVLRVGAARVTRSVRIV